MEVLFILNTGVRQSLQTGLQKLLKGTKNIIARILYNSKKRKKRKKKVFFFHHCEGDIRKVAHVQYVPDKGSKLPKDIYFSELVDRE